jgi:hypothetical protein
MHTTGFGGRRLKKMFDSWDTANGCGVWFLHMGIGFVVDITDWGVWNSICGMIGDLGIKGLWVEAFVQLKLGLSSFIRYSPRGGADGTRIHIQLQFPGIAIDC